MPPTFGGVQREEQGQALHVAAAGGGQRARGGVAGRRGALAARAAGHRHDLLGARAGCVGERRRPRSDCAASSARPAGCRPCWRRRRLPAPRKRSCRRPPAAPARRRPHGAPGARLAQLLAVQGRQGGGDEAAHGQAQHVGGRGQVQGLARGLVEAGWAGGRVGGWAGQRRQLSGARAREQAEARVRQAVRRPAGCRAASYPPSPRPDELHGVVGHARDRQRLVGRQVLRRQRRWRCGARAVEQRRAGQAAAACCRASLRRALQAHAPPRPQHPPARSQWCGPGLGCRPGSAPGAPPARPAWTRERCPPWPQSRAASPAAGGATTRCQSWAGCGTRGGGEHRSGAA